MNAREDLAEVIARADSYAPNDGAIHWQNMADKLLAAGYSKPRTLTDVHDLATVYAGAIIRDAEGQMWGIDGGTDNLFAILDGVGEPYSDRDVMMPAVVIYEGNES